MKKSATHLSGSRKPLRVAIAGAGPMARHHARVINALDDATVVAIADPDLAAQQEILGIVPDAVAFESVDELLHSQICDVLHVCTPPQTHEAVAELALEAGRHVYVEKPFVETRAAATRLAALADSKGLNICPGHQLLYERPTREALELWPALGELAHIESYFSFRATKHDVGRVPLRDDLQLLDILPHPVYVLLDFLERASAGVTELTAVEIGPKGTVHALIRRGKITGTLVVTIEGRPVESYLRLVGTNGSVFADYVRGTVQRSLGPGASGIDKLLAPYRHANQLLTGTTAAMARRVLKRQTSYAGLSEIFSVFYDAIRGAGPVPITRTNLIETVGICEQIAKAFSSSHPRVRSTNRIQSAAVVVTGGTGLLGKEVVHALVARGDQVRVVARRTPPDWERISGVSYVAADLSRPIPAEVMAGATTVIHCAAETAGRWEQHQKNSINATEQVVRAAKAANVKRMIHVSSISVLAVPARGEPLSETTPFEKNSRTGGPYAWGKIESEKLATSLCKQFDIDLRVVRPAALIDERNFDPPGLLGRRIGNIFVAAGMPSQKLGVVDVTFCGQTIAWISRNFDDAPPTLNLFEPELPTKRDLVAKLRLTNPDLTVVWLYPFLLVPLSALALVIQKVMRPKAPALNIAKMFARLRYDTARIAMVAPAVKAESEHASLAEEERLFGGGAESQPDLRVSSPVPQTA